METSTRTNTLPVLPLTTGVVLPQMVVTLALETGEAKAAADAALGGDRRVLLVPRTEHGYARVGTVAHIEDAGDLPSGLRALVVRGVQRAVIGAGVAGDGPASGSRPSWSTRPVRCPTAPASWRGVPRRRREHPRAPGRPPGRRVVARHHRPRGDGRHRRLLARPQLRAQDRGARDPRRRAAPRARARLGARDAGRPHAQGAHPLRRRRRHGEDAARVPAAPAAGGHPQGARRGRRGERDRRVPPPARRGGAARRRARRGRA